MRKCFRVLQLPLLLPALLGGSLASSAQNVERYTSPSDVCLALAKGLSLGAPLPFTKARLEAGAALTVVAFGSSSTTGFGAFFSGSPFPEVMKDQLLRLRPSARIELINSGRIMDDIPGNIARIDSDILRYRPDLVVWQLGTNDVVWRGIADNAKQMLGDALTRLKAANADVVLLDLQYAPLVLATRRYARMEQIIADVAREQNIGWFPRFVLMKRAIELGVTGLVSWDGLHNSAEGHRCIGVALAQMIDTAAR